MYGRLFPILMGGPVCWLTLLATVLLAGPAPTAQASDRIWSAIVLASQVEKPKAPPSELARLAPKIGQVFGCNQLQLLGSASREADDPGEHWLAPTQHFSLSVKSKRAGDNGYELQIAVYHDKKKLVDTEAHVAPDSPLIIRGPMHTKGQLIIAVQVVR